MIRRDLPSGAISTRQARHQVIVQGRARARTHRLSSRSETNRRASGATIRILRRPTEFEAKSLCPLNIHAAGRGNCFFTTYLHLAASKSLTDGW